MIHNSKFKSVRLSNEYFFEKFKFGTIKDHSDIKELSLHYDDGQGILTDDERLDMCLEHMSRETIEPMEGLGSYL